MLSQSMECVTLDYIRFLYVQIVLFVFPPLALNIIWFSKLFLEFLTGRSRIIPENCNRNRTAIYSAYECKYRLYTLWQTKSSEIIRSIIFIYKYLSWRLKRKEIRKKHDSTCKYLGLLKRIYCIYIVKNFYRRYRLFIVFLYITYPSFFKYIAYPFETSIYLSM